MKLKMVQNYNITIRESLILIPSYLILSAILIRIVLLFVLTTSLRITIISYRGYQQSSVSILVVNVLTSILFTTSGIILTLLEFHDWVSLMDGFQGIIIGFLIILFLEAYESSHPNPLKIALATFFATTSLYFLLILGLGKIELVQEWFQFVFIGFFIIPAYFIFILITSHISISRMKKYVSKFQRMKMNGLLGFVYMTFGGITAANAIGQNFLFQNFDVTKTSQYFYYVIFMQLIFIIAYSWFYFALLKDNNPGVFQPQKIDKIIIISSSGIPVYTKDIEVEVQQIDDTLLTGALTAISAVLKEATNAGGDLRLIQLGDQNLMISTTEHFALVVFTYQTTTFLKEAIDRIVSTLVRILENESFVQLLSDETSEAVDSLIFQYIGA